MNPKKAIIIGAGPAGLTAAYELLDKTDIQPVIYEMTGEAGFVTRLEAFIDLLKKRKERWFVEENGILSGN